MATDILNKKSLTDIYDIDAMEKLSEQINGNFVASPNDAPYVTTDGIHQVVKLKGCDEWDLWIKGKTEFTTICLTDMPRESAVQFLECRQ